MAQMNVNHQIAWKNKTKNKSVTVNKTEYIYCSSSWWRWWCWSTESVCCTVIDYGKTMRADSLRPTLSSLTRVRTSSRAHRGHYGSPQRGCRRGMRACQIIFPSNKRRFQQSSRPSRRGKSLLVHWHNGAIEEGSNKDFAINQITIIKPHCYKQTWQRLNSVKSDAKQLPHACWSSTNFPSCLFPKDSMTPWTLAVEKRQH